MDCKKINVIPEKKAVTLVFKDIAQTLSMIWRLVFKLFKSYGSLGIPVRITGEEYNEIRYSDKKK